MRLMSQLLVLVLEPLGQRLQLRQPCAQGLRLLSVALLTVCLLSIGGLQQRLQLLYLQLHLHGGLFMSRVLLFERLALHLLRLQPLSELCKVNTGMGTFSLAHVLKRGFLGRQLRHRGLELSQSLMQWSLLLVELLCALRFLRQSVLETHQLTLVRHLALTGLTNELRHLQLHVVRLLLRLLQRISLLV